MFERAERIGGVWHHNTYPGAACDIPSHLYEFSFAPNPRWSRRYAPQAEIQAYLEDVARRYGVLDRIRTGVEVHGGALGREPLGAADERGRARGGRPDHRPAASSDPERPAIPGLDRFAGPAFHTARWRHDVDLAGRRVAVVGTGCSAIQVVPAIQPRRRAPRRLPALAGLDDPEDGLRLPRAGAAAVRALPAAAAARPRGRSSPSMEFGARGDDAARGCCRPFRALGRRQINAAITDPALRRKVTPTDESAASG